MTTLTRTHCQSHGWLDSLAVGMSMMCAIHCLVTPALIIFLPLLATTFWVHQDFHLWMMLLVLPTTGFAMFLGCRKHKDKWVLALGVAGLLILSAVAVHGSFLGVPEAHTAGDNCLHCIQAGSRSLVDPISLTNFFGGLLLIFGHARNFLLCRKQDCQHD